jgi:ATP-dependent Clp protease ATP-binding subunit ClpA
VFKLTEEETARLVFMEKALHQRVIGQEEAISSLSKTIRRTRAGLKDPKRPSGSFIFAGPTGVGKTELARQLAERLGVDLVRFDMSEYQEAHTVSRLIGAPPGYVGSDKGGLLTDAIAQKPHAVLLLDEIEKAHPAVYNLLLQVMDNGTLTDTDGRSVNFRNVFLVMTTNAGAEARQRVSIGFNAVDHTGDGDRELAKVFAPEFRNRLDATVAFNPLSADAVARVVDKNIADVSRQLLARRVILEVSPAARARLAKDGYDPKMGARPMARQVHEHIKKPLSGPMLFGDLVHGGTAHLDVDATGAWAWTYRSSPPEEGLATAVGDDNHRPATWSESADAVPPIVQPCKVTPTEEEPIPVPVPRRPRAR